MKRFMIFTVACMIAAPVLAQQPVVVPGNAAETVSDEELRQAAAACSETPRKHKEKVTQPDGSIGWNQKWDAGWEHCSDVMKAYEGTAAGVAAKARQDFQEQLRQKSLTTANKLKGN